MLNYDVNERWPWRFSARIRAFDLDGNVIDDVLVKNKVTDAGLNLIRDGIRAVVTDTGTKYLAWGNSTATPSSTSTALGNELGRKAVTSYSAGAAGSVTTTVYLSPSDANTTIEELGWFSGATASSTAGAGVMIARVLYSRTKTNLESIQIDRSETFAST